LPRCLLLLPALAAHPNRAISGCRPLSSSQHL
jgi:hypothetical protein